MVMMDDFIAFDTWATGEKTAATGATAEVQRTGTLITVNPPAGLPGQIKPLNPEH
jgi:hypothetical protein